MTISTTSNKAIGIGNGLTTSFNFGFIVPLASQLVVLLTDALGNITVIAPNQYSVTGLNNPAGGSVGYPLTGSPIPTGSTLTTARIVSYQQLTDLINQSGYYPDVVEAALDYKEMEVQQLAEAQTRMLQFPIVDVSPNTLLPAAAARANKVLAFDASGNPIASVTDASNVALAQAAATAAQAAAVQAAATLAAAGLPPSLLALNYLRVNSGATAYEFRTAAQMVTDIGAVDLSSIQTIGGQKNFTLRPVVGTAAPGTSDATAASTGFVSAAIAAAPSGRLINTIYKSASGAYTKATNNPSYIITEVWGAGGGGGGVGAVSNDAAGGGGSGGCARQKIISANLLSSETLTIGAGGAAGANTGGTGGTGGTSSFGSHSSATGGSGGTYVSLQSASGGLGGVGVGGDINLSGNAGTAASCIGGNQSRGGNGAGSSLGGLGLGGGTGTGSSTAGQNAAVNSGSGGGGAASAGAGALGGVGGSGFIIIYEYA